jgi:hypothetical protein
MRTLPPESEWFRPPRHYELRSDGDTRYFMWVAEITRREIYAVSYKISRSLEWLYDENSLLSLLQDAAKGELYKRIEIEERVPEGVHMDACMWVPLVMRKADGTIMFGNSLDAIDIEISPQGVIVSSSVPIDTKNLYLRPGRFIAVDGPPHELEPGSGA